MKKIFSLLFDTFFEYKNDRLGKLERKYKVYKILFFKFKFKVLPIKGKNNKIFITQNGVTKEVKNMLPQISIIIEGDNNIIEIGDIKKLYRSGIEIRGDNNKVKICDSKHYVAVNIRLAHYKKYNNRTLIIGENLLSGYTSIILLGDNRKLTIGKDCMFSSGIELWTTDMHPIYDLSTGDLINEDKDISIGNHVWFARNVSIHKGAVIPDNCVVGAHAIVTKKFSEPNCLIAGIPAKILKKNIRWEREY